jgi:putative ABC transport system ATP-binding protein
MEPIVKVDGLCKTYGKGPQETCALQDINLEIAAESFTAIVGRSGSGKTTLLNILGGLEAPTEGMVQVQGCDLYAMKDAKRTVFRRKHMGYIFQFFNLIPELTVYENICLPAYLDHRTPDEAFLADVLEQLGLTQKRNSYPAELSGGQQQRVAVARALGGKPDIILADEPTGNLDKRSGTELMDLLELSYRLYKQTILLVTHDLEIARTAQRIITLEDGKLLSDVQGAVL